MDVAGIPHLMAQGPQDVAQDRRSDRERSHVHVAVILAVIECDTQDASRHHHPLLRPC